MVLLMSWTSMPFAISWSRIKEIRRPRPAPIGVRGGGAEVRRGQFSLKTDFLAVFGLRSGPDGSGQAVGFIWSLFRAKPSILDPFRTIMIWARTDIVDRLEPSGPGWGRPLGVG